MTRLGVWSIEGPDTEEGPQRPEPRKVDRSHIGLEKHLEDWIVNDVTLVAEGLTLVGRQVSIDDGRLDLLAIDFRDRWVVIEVKPDVLTSGSLSQALYYASSLARLPGDELHAKLKPQLGDYGDAEALSTTVQQQLEGEGEERDIAVLLVGAGIHPGLERMSEFLGRFGVPISVVSFEVFELDGGAKLLIRDAVDEPVHAPTPRPRFTIEAIRDVAVQEGVVSQFDRFVRMSADAGLAVQPQKASVRIAPPADRRHFLLYASPYRGGLGIYTSPSQFAKFFPITEEEAAKALAPDGEEGHLTGAALDARLDQIELFLTERIKPLDPDAA